MKEELKYFNFNLEPGKSLNKTLAKSQDTPVISIITPYYNSKAFFNQTFNCVLNQTFPHWEWIIVNDGSTEEGTKEFLDTLSKQDSRIKVYHNENHGPIYTRTYAINKSTTDLIFMLDSDDLIDHTILECLYFALKTNPTASWAYTNTVGFYSSEYLWDIAFSCNKEKKENLLIYCSLIRKADFLASGGYDNIEKDVHEDWQLWLNMLSKGYRPLRVNYYGFWYRRLKGRMESINSDKEKLKKSEMIIRNYAKKVQCPVEAIQFPTNSNMFDFDSYPTSFEFVPEFPNATKVKHQLLFIFPWLIVGGADNFNYDFISRLDKEQYDIHIILTEHTPYILRQKFEQVSSSIFELPAFLNKIDWPGFLEHFIKTRKIDFCFFSNSEYGYDILPWLKSKFPELPMVDYIHAEDWGWRAGGYPRSSVALSKLLDKTYVCTENLKNIMYEKMGRKNNNTDVVYIGIDEKTFDPKIVQKLEENKKVILFACRIIYLKRPLFIVDLAKKMLNNRKDIIFYIVGDGEALQHMKETVTKYNLQQYFKFFGMQENLLPYYKTADVTLITSLTEGLTLTTYESLSMGVPVISSDVGGQKELIDENCGAIIKKYQNIENDLYNFNYSKEELEEYEHAINKILDSTDIDSIKQYCRKKIENNFTIDKMVEKISGDISNIIENGTQVNKELCNNIELAEMFLVINNQMNYRTYTEDKNFKVKTTRNGYMTLKNFLWQFKLYRVFIRILQKFGIVSLKKKIFDKSEKEI